MPAFQELMTFVSLYANVSITSIRPSIFYCPAFSTVFGAKIGSEMRLGIHKHLQRCLIFKLLKVIKGL